MPKAIIIDPTNYALLEQDELECRGYEVEHIPDSRAAVDILSLRDQTRYFPVIVHAHAEGSTAVPNYCPIRDLSLPIVQKKSDAGHVIDQVVAHHQADLEAVLVIGDHRCELFGGCLYKTIISYK